MELRKKVLAMKYCIRFNGQNLAIEAESVVHAVVKIIDICSGITDNMEFQITELINNNSCKNVS